MVTTSHHQSIFISYARQDDEPFVKRLYKDLVVRGHRVWWDRQSMPNRELSFLQEIRDAINEYDALLLIVGPKALSSKYVRAEWHYALSICKPIHPILRLSDYNELPPPLTHRDTPDFRNDDKYDDAFAHLLRHLQVPPVPLGKLWNVRAPEEPFIDRPDIMNQVTERVLADTKQATVVSASDKITVIQGLGGIGKSVLAAAFTHQCEVRRAFSNGIIWIKFGRKPNVLDMLNTIGHALSGIKQDYPSIEIGQHGVHQLLENCICLLVLDDVWNTSDIEVFRNLVADNRCRLLITTRNLTVPLSLGLEAIQLDFLSLEQATNLLEKWAGRREPSLIEIADRLSGLPLALKLAGARLREGMTGTEWLETFQQVSQITIGPSNSDNPHDNLQICLDLSVEPLSPDQKNLYHTLGIFPEDVWISVEVIMRLWRKINPAFRDSECNVLIRDLARLALIELRDTDKMVTLHDLLHDYTRTKLGNLQSNTHAELLNSYKDSPNANWHEIAFDDYLYRFFTFHMSHAGLKDALFAMLQTAPNWLESHFQNTQKRDIAIEHVVSDIYGLYCQENADESGAFLANWLRQRSPAKSKGFPHYTSKLVGIYCAFQSLDVPAMAITLGDRDDIVVDTAVKYVFYLDTVDSNKSLELMRLVSKRVMRLGLPSPSGLRVAFPMVLLLLIEQYRHLNDAGSTDNTLHQLFVILKDMLRRVAYVSHRRGPLRVLGNIVRTWLVKLLKRYSRRILRHNLDEIAKDPDQLRISVDSLEEYARFFNELSSHQRENFRESIPYLNHAHGSILDIRDNILHIFASEDALSTTYINFALTGRSAKEPEAVYQVYQYVYETIRERWPNNINLYAYTASSIAHNMYNLLDLQTNINEDWLAFLKSLVRCHILESPLGYGVTSTPMGRYIYYSLMYYGAIWAKLYPEEPVDLAQELLQLAQNDQDHNELLLYVINSFAERSTFPESYKGILRGLQPYLHHDDPTIRDRLARSLAVIRNKKPSQVDDFLDAANPPQDLVIEVRRLSLDESISELTRRMHEFVTAFIVYASPETLNQITNSALSVSESKTLDEALERALKEVLNQIIGENVFAA